MTLSRKDRIGINTAIISISLLVWVLLLINPGHIMTIEHCHVSAAGPSATSLKMLLDMNPFSSQLLGWGLMVLAMMLPKLILPIQSIYVQSFRRYRFLLALLFTLGYIITWMLAGVLMTGLIMGFNLLMPRSYIPAVAVLVIALLWQFSPVKQRFLNRGHEHAVLPAFGWPATGAALRFGLLHGLWCIGAGWALMLFPMLLPQGHNLAMIVVTFVMLSEHLEHPREPKWNFNLRLKLFKAAAAQARLLLIPTKP